MPLSDARDMPIATKPPSNEVSARSPDRARPARDAAFDPLPSIAAAQSHPGAAERIERAQPPPINAHEYDRGFLLELYEKMALIREFEEGVKYLFLEDLPVVFVCENNLYGASTDVSSRCPEHGAVLHRRSGHQSGGGFQRLRLLMQHYALQAAGVPVPFTPVLENAYRPDPPRIVEAVRRIMSY